MSPFYSDRDLPSHPNHCHTLACNLSYLNLSTSRMTQSEKLETFLIDLVGTLKPRGINKRDEFSVKLAYNLHRPVLSLLHLVCFVCHSRHYF